MLESDREDAGCPVGQRPASGTHLSRLRGLACFPGFRLLLSTRRRAVHIPDLTSPSFRHNRLHLRPLVPARSCPVHFGKGCPRCSMLRLPRSRSPRSHSAATCDPCCTHTRRPHPLLRHGQFPPCGPKLIHMSSRYFRLTTSNVLLSVKSKHGPRSGHF